jgi:2-keto-3-deoxy-6-phosphogluconate aldolase
MREITRMLEDAIDRIKLAAEDVPVIVVGGGSILFPEHIAGASTIVKPPHFDVANAVGVAIAEVSATVDQIFTLANRRREEVLEEAQQRAIQQVIALGAAPGTVELLEVEELMLAYMPGDARRIRVKAAGRLAFT